MTTTEVQPRSHPLTRGLGTVAGVLTFATAGMVDGVVALVRSPAGSLPWRLAPLVLLHCAAVLASAGLFLGLLEDLLFASTHRVAALASLGRWFGGGPRTWFARDPAAAAVVWSVTAACAITLGPVFPAAYLFSTGFHSPVLAATATLLVTAAALVAGVLVGAFVYAPVRALLSRAGRFASPAASVLVVLVLVAAQTVRFIRIHMAALHNLDGAVAAVALAVPIANLLVLALLARRVVKRGVALRTPVVIAAALLPLVAFMASALTFGARQTVAGTIFNRSVVVQHIARAFQLSVDLDHDGYSALFNGGDCNDRNARIHPGADDVPGNGVDENCSGHDARIEHEESDGHMARRPEALAARAPSFFLVSIDAMRPDHMGAYGYNRPTTPNIDRWARAGARFTDAFTASPRSLRSFSTIWTGRYASMIHWGHDVNFPPLEPDNVTLAEQLHDGGYHSAAFVNANYFTRIVGFFQGFDEVHETPGFKTDPIATRNEIFTWLGARENDSAPFFGWVHFLEPHDPYDDLTSPRDFGHEQVDQYDEDIARADEVVAPLLARLDQIAQKRPVYVIVIGDHGEGFGEHGVYHHSFDLHDEALRVPILVRGPGVIPGERYQLASLLDLQPTLLNLAGRPEAVPVSGRSLVGPLLSPGPGAQAGNGWRDRLYAEVMPDGFFPSEQKSLYMPPYKILYDLRRGTWELFDIAHDRGEQHNLFDEQRDVSGAMRERLLAWSEGAVLGSNQDARVIAAARLPREPAVQHPMHVRFGDIVELIGYDLARPTVRIGDTFHAVFYYRVLRRTNVPCWLAVWFDPFDGQGQWPWLQGRHFPIEGRYPTTTWNAGEILRDEVNIHVDSEVRPTAMMLKLAVNNDADGRNIVPTSRDGGDGNVALERVTVVP